MSASGGGVSGLEPIVARGYGAPARGWLRAGVVLLVCLGGVACNAKEESKKPGAAAPTGSASSAADATQPQLGADYGEPIGARVEAGASTPGFEVAVVSTGSDASQLLPAVTSVVARSFGECAGLQELARSKAALSVAFAVVAGQARAESVEAPALPPPELACVKRGLLAQSFPGVRAAQKFLVQFRLTS